MYSYYLNFGHSLYLVAISIFGFSSAYSLFDFTLIFGQLFQISTSVSNILFYIDLFPHGTQTSYFVSNFILIILFLGFSTLKHILNHSDSF